MNKQDILDELSELLRLEERQPNDVSATDIAALLGVHTSTAYDKMRRLVKQGLYTEHEVIGQDGKRMLVWRKVSDN